MTKPTKSSAATTAFCQAKVEGPDGKFLWIDGNGKITAANGTLDAPKPNAFSLVQIKDCPGATETCKASCYVHGLQKAAPLTHTLYVHNSLTIREIMAGDRHAWAGVMAQWIRENAAGGFRWHVSGDIFSLHYAAWIATVCHMAPDVRFWIYTRSFDLAHVLNSVTTHNGGNLSLNLSADKDNLEAAARHRAKWGGRICYLTDDGVVPEGLPDDSVIFPDYSLRGGNPAGQDWFKALPPAYKAMVCPVDYHGKSEERRCGPCSRCIK